MELAENTVVAGRFRLKRLIGKGGMGSVWEAAHLRLDIPCAVKFMDLAAITEAYSRFEREAKAAAQLRSPHRRGQQNPSTMACARTERRTSPWSSSTARIWASA